ncbi:MAG: type VI secretion system protein TssA [Zoogloea sp.]|nr:type VI secretion system protein TssA [Zoogloea sp.]
MDHAGLLQALPFPDQPCGDDLSFSAAFDQILEARRFDDPTLAQGEWVTDVKEADWRGVIRLCEALLATQTKDLRVAGWLTEALGRAHGLAGLADGHALTAALCDSFWDDIHPQPEDGELEQRIGALDWLLAQTTRLLRDIPLTASPKGRYSLADLEAARAKARNPDDESTRLTLDSFDAALQGTPPQHFSDSLRDAERLKAALGSLQATLDARLGDAAPAFGPALDVLDDVTRNLRRHAPAAATPTAETASLPGPASAEATPREAPAVSVAMASTAAGGPPGSRDEALRQLEGIAAFFRRTEPHSPVAYLAEKAVRWGNMPLHEWLRSVVRDDSALLRVEELLGIEAHGDE